MPARPVASPKPLGERHAQLIAELEKIVLEEGFGGFTVSDLAARLSCSKRTLYEIAPSKQELVLIVMDRWLGRIREMGRAGSDAHDDPVDRIDAYLRPGVTESRRAGRAFLEDLQSCPPALALLEAHQRERADALKAILKDGIARGRFRKLHPQFVADIFLASVNRINEPAVLESAHLSFSEAFAEFFALIEHGIVADRAATGAGRRAIKKSKTSRTARAARS